MNIANSAEQWASENVNLGHEGNPYPQADPRTETGWFSSLTGGKTEKEANVAK